MDRQRYSIIAHSQCDFAAPVDIWRARRLLGWLPEGDLLDVGCGFGAWSHLTTDLGWNVTGVDRNETFIERAQESGSVASFVLGDAMEVGVHPCDAMLCVGSTHALGGLEGTLAFARAQLRPAGRLLIGEGFWAQVPDPEYLAVLGAEESEMTTHIGNIERIRVAGGQIWIAEQSSREDWDHYENAYRFSMLEWLEANPSDPDAGEFWAHCDRWYDAYLRWGRATLGFGFYVVGF